MNNDLYTWEINDEPQFKNKTLENVSDCFLFRDLFYTTTNTREIRVWGENTPIKGLEKFGDKVEDIQCLKHNGKEIDYLFVLKSLVDGHLYWKLEVKEEACNFSPYVFEFTKSKMVVPKDNLLPWNKKIHSQFPLYFKQSVFTFLLVLKVMKSKSSLTVPSPLLGIILNFLH